PKVFPYFLIMIGSIVVGFSSIFVKLTNAEPTIDAFYRMFIGGSVLLTLAIFRKESLKPDRRSWLFIIIAAFSFSGDLFFWHRSIDAIGPGLATLIVNLQVFVLAFIGIYFQKENFNNRLLIAIPLVVLGMYFLFGHHWQQLTAEYKV